MKQNRSKIVKVDSMNSDVGDLNEFEIINSEEMISTERKQRSN